MAKNKIMLFRRKQLNISDFDPAQAKLFEFEVVKQTDEYLMIKSDVDGVKAGVYPIKDSFRVIGYDFEGKHLFNTELVDTEGEAIQVMVDAIQDYIGD